MFIYLICQFASEHEWSHDFMTAVVSTDKTSALLSTPIHFPFHFFQCEMNPFENRC